MTVVQDERSTDICSDAGEGEAYWLLGMLEIVKISGADTNGEYGLLEVTVRAGEGSPWHVHPDEDEWFYVLDGEFTVYVGDERLSLPAGSFAFGPKGVPHTFIGETDGRRPWSASRRSSSRASCARSASRQPSACCRRRWRPAGHGAADPDRRAERHGDPRASRPAAGPLTLAKPPTRS